MENFIIIAILVVLVGFGVYSTVKHFKGKSGCCGSGSYRPRKKKLAHIRYQKIFYILGMHCEHCQNRVEEVVNDIVGVSGKVNLKKGELLVSYEEEVEDELIRARIEKAGYNVLRIEGK